MTHTTGCLLCGAELVYFEDTREMTCALCGKTFAANAACVNNHFVCDACHELGAFDYIETYCLHTTESDPVKMCFALMRSPLVNMHGPEHHFMVPAVLLTAFCRAKNEGDKLAERLARAKERSAKVPGGSCGFCGSCGAAVGTGIFVSIITDSTPLAHDEWRLSNLMTSKSLEQIALHGGPRCCKRDTFLAVKTAVAFVEDHFSTTIPLAVPVQCAWSPRNRECRKDACPFYGKGVVAVCAEVAL